MNLKKVAKSFGVKMDSRPFLTDSFFFLNGIFIGIGLNDASRLLNSPLNNTPLVINGKDSGYNQDFLVQLAIGSLFILADYFGGLKHAAHMGYGVLLGAGWANASEAPDKTVSVTPF